MEEVDQDAIIAGLAEHAGTLPSVPVVVRGPAADRDRLIREAMPDARDRGVLYIPDELGIDPVQLSASIEAMAAPDDMEPLADAEARWRAATVGLDCAGPLFGGPSKFADPDEPRFTIVDGTGKVIGTVDGMQQFSEAANIDPPDELGEDPDDGYPDYPCPDDPDGLHHPGCGCEHY
jgi:hypothetical protein